MTALGLGGHQVEFVDPDSLCISRFSTFAQGQHRCPGIGEDPQGYFNFVIGLLKTGRFDVLIPIHEQGLVFARYPERLPPNVAVALPSFQAYWTALDKARFSRLLTEIDVPQPRTRIFTDISEVGSDVEFPVVVKLAVATASRGVKFARTPEDLEAAKREIGPGEVLVQQMLDGPLEHAQAIFDRGRFVAMHGYQQLIRGAGGGEALKESIYRPAVREAVCAIAQTLEWHGAMSFDYIMEDGVPRLFDSNPRLVEPMSAHLAGTDLIGMLVAVSRGEHPPEAPPTKTGVRTRLGMQAMLGAALRTKSRIAVAREMAALAFASGDYAGSEEELTPLKYDWQSIVPVAATGAAVLLHPNMADKLPKWGWGAGLLTPQSIEKIAAGWPPGGHEMNQQHRLSIGRA